MSLQVSAREAIARVHPGGRQELRAVAVVGHGLRDRAYVSRALQVFGQALLLNVSTQRGETPELVSNGRIRGNVLDYIVPVKVIACARGATSI
jgi:hypothetical protein